MRSIAIQGTVLDYLEPEIDQNVILKFSLVISSVCNKDTDIEAFVPASVFLHCLVLSI